MNVMNLGPNDWVTCPFDQAHAMKYSRFYNHFVECRKKHPDDRRKQCPYNFSELIEPDCYERHISECPYRSLYVNEGQFTKLRDYDAPSHFNIDVCEEKPLRNRLNSGLNAYADSDDEFDSVSVTDKSGFGCYSRQSLFERPSIPVSVDNSKEELTEKRGFGRGALIKQMLERKNSVREIGGDSVRSDESSRSRDDSSSNTFRSRVTERRDDLSSNTFRTRVTELYGNDPLKITKEFGRGRGALFSNCIRD